MYGFNDDNKSNICRNFGLNRLYSSKDNLEQNTTVVKKNRKMPKIANFDISINTDNTHKIPSNSYIVQPNKRVYTHNTPNYTQIYQNQLN